MLINNKYKIIDKIGSGTFGSIYKGENIRTNEKVAIKVEPILNETKLLKNESIVYQYLKGSKGVPQVKWFGKDVINYYMVINLFGESLQTLKNRHSKFSLQLTLKIGIQLIDLVKTIHEKGLIHRDIKPDNFLFGLEEENKTKLHIIDFGFCKTYLDADNNHIKQKKTTGVIGSATYTSVNSHYFLEQSRRDDLESVGYILLYLYFGELEWQNVNSGEHNKMICNTKERIIENNKNPAVLIDYFNYVKSLQFEETPDYLFLTDIIKSEIQQK
jgi:casein kinase I family protein HRR25